MLSQIREDLPQVEENEGAHTEAPLVDNTSVKKETIHIVTEKKGRKGKTATIAEGFLCDDDELEEIASRAKRHLGVGGSARGGEILIQGDCRDRLAAFLRTLGFKVR